MTESPTTAAAATPATSPAATYIGSRTDSRRWQHYRPRPDDIFICTPSSLGENTSCTFSLFWDGTANDFAGEVLDGFFIGP